MSKEMRSEESQKNSGGISSYMEKRKKKVNLPLMCAIFHLFPSRCFLSSLHMLFSSLLVKSLAL